MRQQVVTHCRDCHSLLLIPHDKQHAQRQEQQIGRQECQTIGTHVFLSPAQRLTRQVLLHHVLIHTSHHQHDEYAAQELLPEMLLRHPVVHHEDARQVTTRYRTDRFRHAQSHFRRHLIYNKEKRSEETEGLQRVSPHQRLDTTLTRVEPYQEHHACRSHDKRNTHWRKHKALQNHTHHVETHCIPHHRF